MFLGSAGFPKETLSGFLWKTVEKPQVLLPNELNLYWLGGFISADGSFDVRIIESKTTVTGYRVQLRFRITQHIRDIDLMNFIILRLGCGSLYKYPNGLAVYINVVSFEHITDKIIPLLNGKIEGVKRNDYLDWCKIHNLMLDKKHLTPEGLNTIRSIKDNINRGRKI